MTRVLNVNLLSKNTRVVIKNCKSKSVLIDTYFHITQNGSGYRYFYFLINVIFLKIYANKYYCFTLSIVRVTDSYNVLSMTECLMISQLQKPLKFWIDVKNKTDLNRLFDGTLASTFALSPLRQRCECERRRCEGKSAKGMYRSFTFACSPL